MKLPTFRITLKIIASLILVSFIISVALIFHDYLNPIALQAEIKQFGWWAPVIFVFLYTLATIAFVPGTIMLLAGGYVFGLINGTLLNLLGAVLGSSASFLIARYLAAEWVRNVAGNRVNAMMLAVAKQGGYFVAMLRLVPFTPFNLVNYILGLTPINLGRYTLISAICMIPNTIAYTYLGYLGSEAAAKKSHLMTKSLTALGLLALAACLPIVMKKIRSRNNPDKD